MINVLKVWLVVMVSISCLFSQENEIFHDQLEDYKLGNYFFDHHLYGASIDHFNQYLNQNQAPLFGDYDKLRRQALIDKGIAGIRINLDEAENQLNELIDRYSPEPIVIPAKLELASYYYNNKNYLKSIEIYDKLDVNELSDIEMSEMSFKKGYSYFVNKYFDQAGNEFNRTKDIRNEFYYPVNYYNGMVKYFKGEYGDAAESFRKVANSPAYASYIPYYITQIYFVQKDYDRLISYAEQKITEPGTQNKKEIRLLLGQTYYIKNDFERALPHLEYYESNTEQLTVEEFYQLAFTQYQLGQYAKAKENFIEITNEDSKLGQLSNYYLADCYTRLNDKVSARTAFKKVSQMDYEASMKEEATFNYGKISAELDYEREAINILIDITEKSPYYDEAQSVINDILINSGDYSNSIKIIESLPRLSNKLKATYQSLCLKKGIQLYAEKNLVESMSAMDKSLKYPQERNYSAQAKYWKGQIYNDNKEYQRSLETLNEYFDLANGLNDLPQESSSFMASYVQAYNNLKLKDYKQAELNFKNCIVGINIQDGAINNDYILNRVLPDAFVRTGDCLFKQNKYAEARKFYNQAITRKQGSYVYALYQRALIEGLMSEPYDEIVTLEEIINQHHDSEYVDDAYYQLGETYFALGNPEKAAVSYIDIMSKFGNKSPYFMTAQLKMGLINYNRGDIQKALSYYKDIFKYQPTPKERQEALRAIEEIYIEDLAKSDAYFKFLDSIPGFVVSDFTRDSLSFHAAESLFLKGEYTKAIPSFTEYLANYSPAYFRHDALYMRAESYTVNKDYTNALTGYESLIAEESSKYIQKALPKAAAITYNFTQEFEKSLRYYTSYESSTTDPNEKYMAQLGALRSAFKLGKDVEVQKYANLVNENRLANSDERASALYYLGKAYFKQGQNEQAKAAFSQVEKLVSTNQAAESKYLIAEILFKEKKYAEVEKQCNYINETCLNYPFWVAKSLLLMSDIFVIKDDVFNARAAVEAVLENFKDNEDLNKLANEKLEKLKLIEKDQNRVRVDTSKTLLLDQGKGN